MDGLREQGQTLSERMQDGLREQGQTLSERMQDNQCLKAEVGAYASRVMSESEIVDDLFDYHNVGSQQIVRMQAVRDAAKNLVKVLLHNVPACSDRGAAIEGVRLAAMMASNAISRDGRPVIK